MTVLKTDLEDLYASVAAGVPVHHTAHEPGGTDAMAADAAAGTASLRSLGTGAQQATAGTDARLSDARTPLAHAHDPSQITGTAVVTADSRLSDARTPTSHATSHKSGGSDTIALDTLAAPTDITTLNASTSAHGLLPKLADPGVVPMRVYYSGTTYESLTAAITRFTAYTTLHAGLYRATAYVVDKVHTGTGSVVNRVYYTDRWGAQGPLTLSSNSLTAAGVHGTGSTLFYAAAGTIIEFDNTDGFTGTYDCYLMIEAL